MTLKSVAAKLYARVVYKQIQCDASRAVEFQEAVRRTLLNAGCQTAFGKDFRFSDVRDYNGNSRCQLWNMRR
jgi:hypothetical protein